MTNPNNDRAVLSRVIKFLIAGVFATAATLFIFSAGLASITRNTATTPPEININNAQDPWPPFWFDLIPFHENGKITYQLGLYSRVDQQMFDMVIKVPIPEGTRFLGANTPLETQAGFDGQTVTFSTIALDK